MKLFRTAVTALVLGGAVLGIGMPAMAAQGDCGPRGGMDGRDEPGQHQFMSPELFESMNLTQEQKAGLWDLFQGKRGERRDNRGESKVREVMELTRSGQDVGLGLKTEAQAEIADRIMERQASTTRLYNILTAEQRGKFEAALKERGEERRERPGHGKPQSADCIGQCEDNGNGQSPDHVGQGQHKGDRQGDGDRQGCDVRGRREHDPFMGRMADELNLTDSQKAQIGEIMKENQGDRRERREDFREMRAERRQMMEMAWTANPDQGKMRAAAEKQAAERVEHMLQRGETMKKIRSVLTAEQLEKLDSLRNDGPGHFGPRGQKR